MLEEKHHVLAQEARALNLSEGLIFPLIDKMIKHRTDLMVSEFNGKDINMIPHAAFIAALYELKNILQNKQKLGNAAQAQINKHYEENL